MRRSTSFREKIRKAARWLNQTLRDLAIPRTPALAPVPISPSPRRTRLTRR